MNTKAYKEQACLENSARKAKVAVELLNPDVLIASDDNAQKYLVVPHFKDRELTVVFCGSTGTPLLMGTLPRLLPARRYFTKGFLFFIH